MMKVRSGALVLLCLVVFSVQLERLCGQHVDDAVCVVDDADAANADVIQVLSNLVKTKYFRTFKVDYLRECPFWESDFQCGIDGGGACHVSECDDAEIPLIFQECKDVPASPWGRVIPEAGVHGWADGDNGVWCDCEGSDAVYIDLLKNPDSFTGYSGQDATRVWMALYNENCFGDTTSIEEQCLENRVFYRLISSFHGITTMSICKDGERLDMFKWRLAMFPDRLKNIYFTYLVLINAATKAQETISAMDMSVGTAEDVKVKEFIDEFYAIDGLAELAGAFNFDDIKSISGLEQEYMHKWQNISRVVDCTGCEKCKIHAKLTLLGIGTGLKILFSDDSTDLSLKHNEVIALFNTIYKYSESVALIHDWLDFLVSQEEETESTQLETDPVIEELGAADGYGPAPDSLVIPVMLGGMMLTGVLIAGLKHAGRRGRGRGEKKSQ
ncbi:Endoplasmic reticulum oxidoreductin 1 [Carpediemonas membranifera]|uniref:Endoplasmic reticulum oxidoreductin 1 n=1 Tax=Carpediemonas membranifera TaxID=201153 RepID=A0A8J6B2G2_9EUKA|nr:Endoplasmic reticulum oxidoreductin 1 [Carpediemonas membranifera]|eukprot:KAG9391562.1 Endoplasmic reticulum oxidoreductin 1 [Carpediemonas membranifera]